MLISADHRAVLDALERLADAIGALLWSGTEHETDFHSPRWATQIGGDGWRQAVHPDDLGHLERRADGELRLRDPNGSYRRHRVHFGVLSEARWFALAIDIEARTRGEEEHARERIARIQAEQASAVKDRVLAAISHELRAPLTTILLWERLLREESLDRAGRDRALDAIARSARRQQRLVGDLVDATRVMSGKLRVELRPLELGELLREVVDRVRAHADGARQVTHWIAPDLGRVLGDAGRLEQVFENLLTNATKFTPEGGAIVLSAARSGAMVSVDVADNGRGITPDLLPHVFEPFVQGESDSTAGGLGLGLAIVRELVALHGGGVEAHSTGDGGGARFTVRLPVADEASGGGPRKALAGVRILVVDDDAAVVAALQLLLERVGATVEAVTSARGAWDCLQRVGFDVLLSDLAMPGEDGFALIRRVRRASGELGHLPAVALTAHSGTDMREAAIAAGFDLHVVKPVDLDRLIASVARLVTRP